MVWALFSKLIDFDGPSSKGHISGYNHHRKLRLGSIELYDNTKYHTNRTIDLSKPSLRYFRSKLLRFFETPCMCVWKCVYVCLSVYLCMSISFCTTVCVCLYMWVWKCFCVCRQWTVLAPSRKGSILEKLLQPPTVLNTHETDHMLIFGFKLPFQTLDMLFPISKISYRRFFRPCSAFFLNRVKLGRRYWQNWIFHNIFRRHCPLPSFLLIFIHFSLAIRISYLKKIKILVFFWLGL